VAVWDGLKIICRSGFRMLLLSPLWDFGPHGSSIQIRRNAIQVINVNPRCLVKKICMEVYTILELYAVRISWFKSSAFLRALICTCEGHPPKFLSHFSCSLPHVVVGAEV
jgi:hypothetical protein